MGADAVTVAASARNRRAFDFNALLVNITIAPGFIEKGRRPKVSRPTPEVLDGGVSLMGPASHAIPDAIHFFKTYSKLHVVPAGTPGYGRPGRSASEAGLFGALRLKPRSGCGPHLQAFYDASRRNAERAGRGRLARDGMVRVARR
jgi:hypothetical protein